MAVFAATVYAQDETATEDNADAAPAEEAAPAAAPFNNLWDCKYYCAVAQPDLSGAYNQSSMPSSRDWDCADYSRVLPSLFDEPTEVTETDADG